MEGIVATKQRIADVDRETVELDSKLQTLLDLIADATKKVPWNTNPQDIWQIACPSPPGTVLIGIASPALQPRGGLCDPYLTLPQLPPRRTQTPSSLRRRSGRTKLGAPNFW